MTVEIEDSIHDSQARLANIKLNEDYSNVLIIDGLPKVELAKEEKLLLYLSKNIFTPCNAQIVDKSIFIPRDDGESSLSKGYAFIEFSTIEQAESVFKFANNYRMDKQHMLKVYKFGEYERVKSLNEEWIEPQIDAWEEREYIKGWLEDPLARDQMCWMNAGAVNIAWGPRTGKTLEVALTRNNWSDGGNVYWSSKGSFFVTIHKPGIQIWGGSEWKKIAKFPHANVEFVHFSNTEKYLVTMSPFTSIVDNNLHIWEVATGRLLKTFSAKLESKDQWPLVQFSFNDLYASRISDERELSIYEMTADGMHLLDKKNISAENIQTLQWGPTENNLVYWTGEEANTPARVALISLPSKHVLRTKNLFNVNKCTPYWHSNGNYLLIQVDRFGKNKKQPTTNLELFRIREKDIPVETIEIKESLTLLQWEPNSNRFLVSYSSGFKHVLEFYSVESKQMSLIKNIERKQQSKAFWSPSGEFLVLATSLESSSASFDFWFIEGGREKKENGGEIEATLVNTKEHFSATDAQWDPTGRYLLTWVNCRKQASENSFMIWDAKGDLLHKQNSSKLSNMSWRPRPSTLLSKSRVKEVKDKLDNYIEKYSKEDINIGLSSNSNHRDRETKLARAWNEWRLKNLPKPSSSTSSKSSIALNEDNQVLADEWIEEIIEEIEEKL